VAEQVKTLLEKLPEGSPWATLFKAHQALCVVLSQKCDLGQRIRQAYDTGDREGLRIIAEQEIEVLSADIRTYYQHFRTLWLENNKIFGLEIQDIRYGGLLMRLDSVRDRLRGYLDGQLATLPELDQRILPYDSSEEPDPDNCYASEGYWRKIVSASPLSGV
jgi:hypothetical protein